jgi:hypothetical protein
MAFNKIQPEQVQQPTFFSDSGDFNISQTDTGIQLNLSRGITGDFAFSGELLTNGRSVFGLADTGDNFFIQNNRCILFNGSNTQIRGTGNSAFLADGTQISGLNNVALNVNTANFIGGTLSVAARNTAVHGRGITFGSLITGSLVMKDFTASSQSANKPQSLYSNFVSGHHFEVGQNYFANHVNCAQSGIISGRLEVLGSGFLTGQEITTKHYLTGYASGNYVNLFQDQKVDGTKRFQTGFQIPKWIGRGSQAGTTADPATGSLAISGSTLCVYVGGSTWQGVAISGGQI